MSASGGRKVKMDCEWGCRSPELSDFRSTRTAVHLLLIFCSNALEENSVQYYYIYIPTQYCTEPLFL